MADPNPYDEILRDADSSLRRTARVVVRRDRRTGKAVPVPLHDQQTVLSHDGAPETLSVTYHQVYECGHSLENELGGKCVCNAYSCIACFSTCQRTVCGKPICPECSYYKIVDNTEIRLCRPCYRIVSRKLFFKKLVRVILSPFVLFDNNSNDTSTRNS